MILPESIGESRVAKKVINKFLDAMETIFMKWLIFAFHYFHFEKCSRLPASELSQGLERILPELLSKSGDTALGKNKVATECILKLQSSQHIRFV